MTAPAVEACIEFDPHSQAPKQESLVSSSENRASHNEQMAATGLDTSWSFHGLPQYDDPYNSALSSEQPSLAWPSTPDPAGLTMANNNYHLDSSADSFNDISFGTMSSWPSYNGIHSSDQQYNSAMDRGTPRTFPAVDVDRILPSYNNTVALQQVYQDMPPRSDPYQFGDETDMYTQQNICDTVEDIPPGHQPQMTYSHWMHDDRSSYQSTPMDDDLPLDDEEDFDNEKHEPYAKTLYRCLKEAPNNTMVLRDIYDWFKVNTSRGKDAHEKGWQNSIRHNLSMNQAFEKIENSGGSGEQARRGYQWRLTGEALREGRVQSTTRFRNKQPNKRGSKSHTPSSQRQMSGARGGRMARFTSQARRSARLRNARQQSSHSLQGLCSRAVPMSNVAIGHHGTNLISGRGFSSSLSDPSSPYQAYAPTTPEWLGVPYNMPGPSAHIANTVPQDPYMLTSNPHTPGDAGSPVIAWREPGDGLFCDSSDTNSTNPATPTSPDDGGMYSSMFGFATNDCHM